MPLFRSRRFVKLLLLALGIFAVGVMLRMAGRLLVVDGPQRSDFVLVLSGDYNDVRSKHGLMLLRSGYAQQLILDAPAEVMYGHKLSDVADDYLQTTARDESGHVHGCSIREDSTQQEMREAEICIRSIMPAARTAMVVTSNYHTRRSLSIARRMMPQYQWSAAGAPDPQFRVDWWHSRESAKITLTEWQKLVWWELVERWVVKEPR